MSYRTPQHTSRREIDVAVGILVALRGCSERAAFGELVGVVHDSGLGIGALADGLVALASGASSAGHDEAFAAWGDLLGRNHLGRPQRPGDHLRRASSQA
jgi:ANTAR domain